MKRGRLLILVALAQITFAATVPGRYIVELSTEPVARQMAHDGRRAGLQSSAASSQRTKVHAEQADMRGRLSQFGTVLGSVDMVANALFVQVPDEKAAQLAAIPGVKRVHAVRSFHMVLDRALVVNKVVEAWNQVGSDRAGAGIKIAIIDSGIDASHPGFQDPSLAVPDSYPKSDNATDAALTNNKVIVARSYVDLLTYPDPDTSASDHVGHGTALAMVAAGVQNTGPLATITGVAPKAYLGNYKIFGTPGFNDGATDDAILKAIDDAVADGMDIINLSLGDDLAPRLNDDVEVQAIETATKAGVIVVVAAGNNGPDLNTISSPATAPSAISAGASRNDRTFAASAQASGMAPVVAIPGDGSTPEAALVARGIDVSRVDSSGKACNSLPAGSLNGAIALILRGDCTFEVKLNNAQNAGATGALIYGAADSPDPIPMATGAATLPAEMISNSDGVALKTALADNSDLQVTMNFNKAAVPTDPTRLASFSAAGPDVDGSIKPDLVAVGTDVYVATQTLDDSGDMYDPSGYILVDGTSFSTPLVAGAAALVKSARPGLTMDLYRSLIINSATSINAPDGRSATVQQAGAGLLNAAAALQLTAAAYPTALTFGSGTGDLQVSHDLTITNVGTAAEAFTVLVAPRDNGPAPAVATSTFDLAPGASTTIPVSWTGAGLSAGPHEGFIRVTGATSGAETRIPYWYAVTSGVAAHVSVLDAITSARRGSSARDAVLFRITDASGLPLTSVDPVVSVVSGGGVVRTTTSYDSQVPGLYGLTVRLGATLGTNVFRIQAGNVSTDIAITGR